MKVKELLKADYDGLFHVKGGKAINLYYMGTFSGLTNKEELLKYYADYSVLNFGENFIGIEPDDFVTVEGLYEMLPLKLVLVKLQVIYTGTSIGTFEYDEPLTVKELYEANKQYIVSYYDGETIKIKPRD